VLAESNGSGPVCFFPAWADRAYLYGGAGNDEFAGTPTYSYLDGGGFFSLAEGFTWYYNPIFGVFPGS
jgi:hypothetical protein